MKNKWNWEKTWENLPAVMLSLAAAFLLFFFHRVGLVKEEVTVTSIRPLIHSSLTQGTPADLAVRLSLRQKSDAQPGINLDDLEVVADFQDFFREGTYTVPLKVQKKAGTPQDLKGVEISVEPMELKLHLERRTAKSVPIELLLEDSLAPGQELKTGEFSPKALTVEGPRSRLEKLTLLKTEHIDLLDVTGQFKKEINVVLPDPLLRILEKDKPVLVGEIVEVRREKIWTGLNLQVRNLSPNLVLTTRLPEITLRTLGPQSLTEKLTPREILPILDLTDLNTPGDYRVQITAELPPTMQIQDLTPRFLDLNLRNKEGP